MTSLYLHIPFCHSKCRYCSFTSFAGLERLFPRYCKALGRELEITRLVSHNVPLDTLFIGGGTPTLLGTELLKEIINTCSRLYGFAEEAEISIESNPGATTASDFQQLRKYGANRLSLGIQSWHKSELRLLGRIHGVEESVASIVEARRAGFTNLNLDLMYGIPGQTLPSWRDSLLMALDSGPEHLSVYQLSIDEGSEFEKYLYKGTLTLPSEDHVLEMDELAAELCAAYGLHHYEIANYALPGYECAHNKIYWRNEEYLACGAGAVSYIGGTRCRRLADPEQYCRAIERGESVIVEQETLDRLASFRETVVIGLRLLNGVSESRLLRRYDLSFEEVYGSLLRNLLERGLIEMDKSSLRLTRNGRQYANVVMAELV